MENIKKTGNKNILEAIRRKIIFELKEIVYTGEYRKEFFIMFVYSSVLFALTLIAIKAKDLLLIRTGYLVASFIFLGMYFFADDYVKRKNLVNKRLLFWIDSFVYTAFIGAIVYLTGGHDSPIRFPLFFLTVISAPLYGGLADSLVFIFIIFTIQIALFFRVHNFSSEIIFPIMEGFTMFASGAILKISINLYQYKAQDYKVLGEEQERLNYELTAQKYSLEKVVNEKTEELRAMLLKAETGNADLSDQQAAMINILEDASETQETLKKSKETLEKRQRELESLSDLSKDLANAINTDEVVNITVSYLEKFLNYSVLTFFIFDDKKENIFLRSYVKEIVPAKLIETAKKEIFKFLFTISVFRKSEEAKLTKYEGEIVGKELIEEKDGGEYLNFTMPLMAGQKICGAIHISDSKADSYKKSGAKEIIEAILSTASVSISGLQKIMKSQNSKTDSMIKSLSNGVVMIDANWETILLNPAAAAFTGLGKEYEKIADFIKIKKIDGLEKLIKDAMKKGRNGMIDELGINEKYFEVFVNPVKDLNNAVSAVAIIFHDVTNIKAIDKMKTEFVSVASHQLRTPLTAIKLFTEMLVNGEVGELQVSQKEYLSNIYQSTDRMARLVNDLLNVTRIESGRLSIIPEPTELDKFIKIIIMEIEPLANAKGCKINFSFPEGKLEKIMLDQNLMRQVIHNLIVNGVKYSRNEGGIVEVIVSEVDKSYLISVSDNGIGIPKESQSRIFEKFYRADNAIKKETEGTGLGLYVSKMIVESSNGKMRFESRENEGTTFFVEIPNKGMEEKKGEKTLSLS